jgi:hypothetical protein
MVDETDLLTCSEFAVLVGRSERSIQRYLKQQKLVGLETVMGMRIPRFESKKFSLKTELHIPDQLHQPTTGSANQRQGETSRVKSRQQATLDPVVFGQILTSEDSQRQVATVSELSPLEFATEPDSYGQAATESDQELSHFPTATDKDRQISSQIDSFGQTGSAPAIPMEIHFEALKGIQEALRQVNEQRLALEEQRQKLELVERQKWALEVELKKYQLVLAEQADSLAEARALTQAAQCLIDTPKGRASGWSARWRRFLGLKTG